MNMVPTVFFGLMCLSLLIVMGNGRNWVVGGINCDKPMNIPERIPWPAQQCINRGYVGECVTVFGDTSYKEISPCKSLKCAQLTKDGSFALARIGRPSDGTICGILKACHNGNCIDIDPDQIPTQTGARSTYDCGPPLVSPKSRSYNATRARALNRKRTFR